MALGDGKAAFLQKIEARRQTFINNIIAAEDAMVAALMSANDPSQNDTQRRQKLDKVYTELKAVHEIAFDGTMDEIKNYALVNLGIEVTIPVTSSPGTPSKGSTTKTGTIS